MTVAKNDVKQKQGRADILLFPDTTVTFAVILYCCNARPENMFVGMYRQ